MDYHIKVIQMLYRLAYEIGGTNNKAVCVNVEDINKDGFTIDDNLIVIEPTVKGVGKENEFIAQLRRIGDEALRRAGAEKSELDGIGIGSPGPLNTLEGTIVSPVNFEGMGTVHIVDAQSEYFGTKNVHLENDVSTASLGERNFGIGKIYNCQNFVVVTSGTGLGGGVIVNGRMPTGWRGNFAEIGHTIVDYTLDARADGCTRNNPSAHGHWEAYCAAHWLGIWAADAFKELPNNKQKNTLLYTIVRDGIIRKEGIKEFKEEKVYSNIRAEDVFEAYMRSDPFAVGMVDDFREYHARGLSTVITNFNPEYITLMGPLHLNNTDIVLHNLRADGTKDENHLAKRALELTYSATAMQPKNLIITPLGNKIGLYGAIALVDEKKKEYPFMY